MVQISHPTTKSLPNAVMETKDVKIQNGQTTVIQSSPIITIKPGINAATAPMIPAAAFNDDNRVAALAAKGGAAGEIVLAENRDDEDVDVDVVLVAREVGDSDSESALPTEVLVVLLDGVRVGVAAAPEVIPAEVSVPSPEHL